MISIRQALPDDLDTITRFYASVGHSINLTPSCKLLVAEEDSVLVGAVRLCDEHGHLVLRTMRIAPSQQRQGLGSEMLRKLVPLMEHRDCYSIPYAHLTGFYGVVGFETVEEEKAPKHLRVRLERYH